MKVGILYEPKIEQPLVIEIFIGKKLTNYTSYGKIIQIELVLLVKLKNFTYKDTNF